MPELIQYCDIIMGNIWAEATMLNIPINQNLLTEKGAYLEQAQKSSEDIIKLFPKCKQVANTFRFDSDDRLHYYATLFKNGKLFVSSEYFTEKVVDRVGSGDTFMAGLIYGNHKGYSSQEIIDFSAAAAFNKLFVKGDATTSSVEEIKNFTL
jgi:2-dehydro-3-deoxygluconokinase